MKSLAALLVSATLTTTALAADNFITHTVVNGDNLWALHLTYGTTVDDIKLCNDMSNDNLQLGQQLRIPTTDKKGLIAQCIGSKDTWATYANDYNMKPEYLAVLSGKDAKTALQPKDCVLVPDFDDQFQLNFDFKAVKFDSETNLVDVAKDWKSTPQTIRQLNNLDDNVTKLVPGIYLGHDGYTRVKHPVTLATKYIFGQGDTIEMVSEKYQVSLPVLKAINGISEDTTNLNAGQWLHIPMSDGELKEEFTDFIATAYHPLCPDGCSGVTATGIKVVPGGENAGIRLVATDPTVIPLGSVVYSPVYGWAAAWDTGTAIKGKKIDCMMVDTDEAIAEFGRKTDFNVKVYQAKGGNDDEEDSGTLAAASLGALALVAALVLF